MFASLIVSMLASVAFTPLWVRHLYEVELEIQRTQIILDNTAIRMGRKVRKLLRQIKTSENKLSYLHAYYHGALACSLVPATAGKCLQASKKLRSLMRMEVESTVYRSKQLWQKAFLEAQNELTESHQKLDLMATPTLDLPAQVCSKCRLTNGWNINTSQLIAHFKNAQEPRLQVRVSYEKKREGMWNYRLSAH